MPKSTIPGPTGGSASPKEPSSSSDIARGAKTELLYRAFAGSDELAPLVPIEIARPGRSAYRNELLIDSGADTTVFPKSYMDEFGVTTDQCTECNLDGACGTGGAWAYEEGVQARILGIDVTLRIVFADTEEPVLGRGDFFHAFRVTLDQRAGLLTLEPYADMVQDRGPQAHVSLDDDAGARPADLHASSATVAKSGQSPNDAESRAVA